jgi:phosphoglycerate dehydrogenase-like enzyme
MVRTLVSLALSDDVFQTLRASIEDADLRLAPQPSDNDLQWAEVIFGNVPADRLQAATALTWLHSPNASLDAYAEAIASRTGVDWTHSDGIAVEPVTDHGIALLFALSRNVPLLVRAQAERRWDREGFAQAGQGMVLAGREAHILGFGPIGQRMAEKLDALGMQCVVYRTSSIGTHPSVSSFHPISELSERVVAASVLINLLPLNPATRGVVGSSVFDQMADGAIYLGLGRGATVDQSALVKRLEAGTIRAAFDVFAVEPLPESSSLWTLPNVLISPHVAGRFDHETAAHVAAFATAYQDRYQQELR